MSPEARREFVSEILFGAQKCRSNFVESFGAGTVEMKVFADLNPTLDPEYHLNLVDVCARVLEGEREVEPGDVFNVLTLAHRSPVLQFWWALYHDEPLPESLSAFAEGRV